MYTWFRTYNAKIGKMEELLELSQEAAAHLNKKHNVDCEVYCQMGGDPSKIGLVGRYATLGDLGDRDLAIAGDEQWAKIVQRAAPLVVEGTVADQFWKKL